MTDKQRFIVVIPARLAASRLPGKLLLAVKGKPVLRHTWEKALKSNAEQVIIATDDDQIKQEGENFGAEVCLTAGKHRSGTERLGEVVKKYRFDPGQIVVNLQGDEPLMPEKYINTVAQILAANPQCQVATLATKIISSKEALDENVVKVVTNIHDEALYFSRAPIPWARGGKFTAAGNMLRHIGMYAYRAGFLREYSTLQPSIIEHMEKLEQLRVLWHGYKIKVGRVKNMPGPGVDNQEDFARVKELI